MQQCHKKYAARYLLLAREDKTATQNERDMCISKPKLKKQLAA
jgi:hypothetical protein